MYHKEIRPVDRSCKSYRHGHQVHWIQAKKSVAEEQPVIYVSAVVHDDGQIDKPTSPGAGAPTGPIPKGQSRRGVNASVWAGA
jgi:hypothetical protein